MTEPAMKSTNTVWQDGLITREMREALNDHKSFVLWFTGLSSAGKSTLACAVEEQLYAQAGRTYVLDGDNIRQGLCGDLGFSDEARTENIRRISEVAKLFADAGVIVLTAFISPFIEDRAKARELVGDADFIEVFCDCSLAVCEERDVKGLYRKARAGEIKEFTGITSPYEAPESPELRIDTGAQSLDACVAEVLAYLREHNFIPAA